MDNTKLQRAIDSLTDGTLVDSERLEQLRTLALLLIVQELRAINENLPLAGRGN